MFSYQLLSQRKIFAACAAQTGYDYLLAKRKGAHCEEDFNRAVLMISLVDSLQNFNPEPETDNKDVGFITNEQAESILEKLSKLCTYRCEDLVPLLEITPEQMIIDPPESCCPDNTFPVLQIE